MNFHGSRETLWIELETVAALRQRGRPARRLPVHDAALGRFKSSSTGSAGRTISSWACPSPTPSGRSPAATGCLPNTTNVAAAPQPSRRYDHLPRIARREPQLVLEATAHQHHFFGDLLETLHLPFDASRPPLSPSS